ncbi:hypothetical protein D9M71_830650 [compost metagenome]
MRLQSNQRASFEDHGSRAWHGAAQEAGHQRGLSCSIGTDQGDDLTLINLEIDATQGVNVAVMHIQFIYLKHHAASPPGVPR